MLTITWTETPPNTTNDHLQSVPARGLNDFGSTKLFLKHSEFPYFGVYPADVCLLVRFNTVNRYTCMAVWMVGGKSGLVQLADVDEEKEE